MLYYKQGPETEYSTERREEVLKKDLLSGSQVTAEVLGAYLKKREVTLTSAMGLTLGPKTELSPPVMQPTDCCHVDSGPAWRDLPALQDKPEFWGFMRNLIFKCWQ